MINSTLATASVMMLEFVIQLSLTRSIELLPAVVVLDYGTMVLSPIDHEIDMIYQGVFYHQDRLLLVMVFKTSVPFDLIIIKPVSGWF
jgi:hypothetical protein